MSGSDEDDSDAYVIVPKDLAPAEDKKARGGQPAKGRQRATFMHFDKAGWMTDDLLEEAKDRWKFHNHDVATFFTDAKLKMEYKECFGAILSDIPYATNHGNPEQDPKWTDSLVGTVCAGMRHMANPENCVCIIGCGTMGQCIQWQKALAGAGFNGESEPRIVINTKAAIRRKAHVAPRKNSGVCTVPHQHYWVIAWRGKPHPRAFNFKPREYGFFDKTVSRLQSQVLTECPVIGAHLRLVDAESEVLNPYEKHMGEVIEQLARFVPRDAHVLDFCCGTASAGLAALYMNQMYIVLNDRDSNILPYAEARMRAYLWSMMRSPWWVGTNDYGEDIPSHCVRGQEVRTTWDGEDPYKPLMAAHKLKVTRTKEIVVPHNVPPGVSSKEQFAELYNCVIGETGVFLKEDQGVVPEGTAFPLFGEYKRGVRGEEPNTISAVILKPQIGERKPFFLLPADSCPFRLVRSPDENEKPNCKIEELRCGMEDLFKVNLKLAKDLDTEDGQVELLCKYDLKKLKDGWKVHTTSQSGKRKATGRLGSNRPKQQKSSSDAEGDDDAEDVDTVAEDPQGADEGEGDGDDEAEGEEQDADEDDDAATEQDEDKRDPEYVPKA